MAMPSEFWVCSRSDRPVAPTNSRFSRNVHYHWRSAFEGPTEDEAPQNRKAASTFRGLQHLLYRYHLIVQML
jgi:hypothetical protein